MTRIVGFYNFDFLDKVACALFTLDGRLIKANRVFKEWCGGPRKAHKGASVFKLFPKMPEERFNKGINKRSRFSYRATIDATRREDFDAQLAFRKIDRRGQELIFLQGTDRSREKEKDAILTRATQLLEKRNRELDMVNRDLTEAYDRLLLSGKLTSVGKMATSMILEMRHPVELIMVNAQLLDDHIRDREATEMLQAIIQAGTQVSKIVEGLRGFSQSEGREAREIVSLQKVLKDVTKLIRKTFASNKVKLSMPKVDPTIGLECIPTEISQVLLNLLNNAVEAQSGEEGAWTRVEVETADDKMTLSVIDSGDGLPAELTEKLMEPFFTTKAAGAGTGTGLGLTIARKITESHGGQFILDTESENTRFAVVLPMVTIEEEDDEDAED